MDRQCTVDAEWVSGYWAFQEGQCPVPEQTLLQTTTTVDLQTNNCCSTGWQCHSDADWARGYRAFQTNQCEHPEVAIEGSEDFVNLVKDALHILKTRTPGWFTYVGGGLDKIRLVPEESGLGLDMAARTWNLTPGAVFGPPGTDRESLTLRLASGLVHDACHVHRYEAGLPAAGYVGEKACLQVQVEATEVFDTDGYHYRWYRHLLENIDDPEFQWWQDHFSHIPSS